MKSFIKCVSVNSESSRIEEFNGEKHSDPVRLELQGIEPLSIPQISN